jgi:hypothetical protein
VSLPVGAQAVNTSAAIPNASDLAAAHESRWFVMASNTSARSTKDFVPEYSRDAPIVSAAQQ